MSHWIMLSPCSRNALGLTLIILLTTLGSTAGAQDKESKAHGSFGSGGLNLFEKHKAEYVATAKPAIVDTAPAKYLTLSGKGAPSGDAFRSSVGKLYGTVYGIKMKSAMAGRDFVVSPLEAIWWGNKSEHDFLDEKKESWNWKVLIRVPEFITQADLDATPGDSGKQREKGGAEQVTVESISEGKCVQVMHVGPYSNENKTIAEMSAFAKSKGLKPNGKHHEIYISDPNRTAPEKLQTILRLPVKKE